VIVAAVALPTGYLAPRGDLACPPRGRATSVTERVDE
jgi:hypothetical protein